LQPGQLIDKLLALAVRERIGRSFLRSALPFFKAPYGSCDAGAEYSKVSGDGNGVDGELWHLVNPCRLLSPARPDRQEADRQGYPASVEAGHRRAASEVSACRASVAFCDAAFLALPFSSWSGAPL